MDEDFSSSLRTAAPESTDWRIRWSRRGLRPCRVKKENAELLEDWPALARSPKPYPRGQTARCQLGCVGGVDGNSTFVETQKDDLRSQSSGSGKWSVTGTSSTGESFCERLRGRHASY